MNRNRGETVPTSGPGYAPGITTGCYNRKLRPEVAAGGYGRGLRPGVTTGSYNRELRPEVAAGGYGRKLRLGVAAGGCGWEVLRPKIRAG